MKFMKTDLRIVSKRAPRAALALLLALLFLLTSPLGALPVCAEEGQLELQAKSVILTEASTGRVLYESNADEPLPPASVTKIMTLLLVMEALDEKKFSLDDPVSVSERAAGMGGSQVYLEPGEKMTVNDLLKCVAVASANDAAAALAELVSGSLESFVSEMNRRAAELGMSHTHFENVSGLDDTTTSHLTSARDVATMSAELLKHEKIFDYTTIWMDSVRNGAFGLTNTNRLIRFYEGANGLKTGSTSKAGFCISATAKRGDLQLIAVVMGSPTRDARNAAAAKLLDHGFANYEAYRSSGSGDLFLPVTAGKKESVRLTVKDYTAVLEKGQGGRVQSDVQLPEKLTAPVKEGEPVGRVVWTLDGEELAVREITAAEDVARLTLFDVFARIFSLYTSF